MKEKSCHNYLENLCNLFVYKIYLCTYYMNIQKNYLYNLNNKEISKESLSL